MEEEWRRGGVGREDGGQKRDKRQILDLRIPEYSGNSSALLTAVICHSTSATGLATYRPVYSGFSTFSLNDAC